MLPPDHWAISVACYIWLGAITALIAVIHDEAEYPSGLRGICELTANALATIAIWPFIWVVYVLLWLVEYASRGWRL